jgi:uncharacterized protein
MKKAILVLIYLLCAACSAARVRNDKQIELNGAIENTVRPEATTLNYRKTAGGFLLVLDSGQKVIQSLMELMKAEQIQGANFNAIGALRNTEIAYYSLEKKAYVPKKFEAPAEVVAFSGNLGWTDHQPIVHAHVALAGTDYKVFGGHLKEAEVSLTLEIFITTVPFKIERADNKNFPGVKTIGLRNGHQ